MSDHDGETGVLRRAPSQARARERVETLLAAATEIIREKGSDALKMSGVAKRAGVSIGSLYQYFPDKSALVRTLFERTNEECRHCIEAGLAGASTPEALSNAFEELIDEYLALFRADPVIRDIRFAVLADKTLQDLEIAESRVTGGLLANAILRVRPGADPERVRIRAFTLMHLGEATMRLAASLDAAEGDAVVDSYKAMAAKELLGDDLLG